MAAPVAAAVHVPAGRPLASGHRTRVSIAADTDYEFFEKTVTPIGIEGGDAKDITTQHNTLWRTKTPGRLLDLTELTMEGSYDATLAYTSMASIINVCTTITIFFPDGSTLAFYGFVKSFIPGQMEEGEQPMATITIVPNNYDPINCIEEGPVFVNVGTGANCCTTRAAYP